MSARKMALGKKGEVVARGFLEKAGYTILATNYRTRSGEIDIIARHRKTLVFVEVKTRRDNTYGSALEAVTPRKQKQISRVATEYIIKNGVVDSEARFDVVAISFGTPAPKIDLVKNAFECTYG